MSKETGEFFKRMVDDDLFDLTTKPNKEMGGYCTDLFDYKVPFIFSNFNGEAGDVNVLCHEAGHHFNLTYLCRQLKFPTSLSQQWNHVKFIQCLWNFLPSHT